MLRMHPPVLTHLTHLPFSEAELGEGGWGSRSPELCPSLSPSTIFLETTLGRSWLCLTDELGPLLYILDLQGQRASAR